ncbi:Os02g0589450 [Oryza sativa Japonica Group]|uniref:Os02g0589450 protein n=1 Tax=Oryza sativa subsp. japonica TaxID=39947 RepID=A0A0P0VL12_ORYSJ|nr:hypothetical protein EE612_012111 [Oryza sativa]BAS79492.1 Os02g0589450 [Oryza sativa Japonica Group]
MRAVSPSPSPSTCGGGRRPMGTTGLPKMFDRRGTDSGSNSTQLRTARSSLLRKAETNRRAMAEGKRSASRASSGTPKCAHAVAVYGIMRTQGTLRSAAEAAAQESMPSRMSQSTLFPAAAAASRKAEKGAVSPSEAFQRADDM